MRPASPDEIIGEALELVRAGYVDESVRSHFLNELLKGSEKIRLISALLPRGLNLIRNHVFYEDVDQEILDSLKRSGYYSGDSNNFILSTTILFKSPRALEPFRTMLENAHKDGVKFISIRFNRCHWCDGVYRRLEPVEISGSFVRLCEECLPDAF